MTERLETLSAKTSFVSVLVLRILSGDIVLHVAIKDIQSWACASCQGRLTGI